jgi:Tol biopolymer transport system component
MNYKNLQMAVLLKFLCISLLFSYHAIPGFAQTQDDHKYVGQTPPGNIPEIFAPGIISLQNRMETYPAFSPDGKKLYFSVVNAIWTQGKIYYTQEQNGNWTQPAVASFSNNNYKNWESFISPDGQRQFFASNRPPSADMDIWMIEKTSESTWSEPIHLSNPINSSAEDGSACVPNGGTLYFKSSRGGRHRRFLALQGQTGKWCIFTGRKFGKYYKNRCAGNGAVHVSR